jgi:uridine kinase
MVGTLPRSSLGVVGSGLLQNSPPRREQVGKLEDALNDRPHTLSCGVRDSLASAGRAREEHVARPTDDGTMDVPAAQGEDDEGSYVSAEQRVGAFFIGVSGASASGKTTVCRKIMDGLADQRCALLCVDWFYRGLTPGVKPQDYNFDHPEAFDFAALRSTLETMQSGTPVSVPRYDFAKHCRDSDQAAEFGTVDVVIVEGILTFYDPRVREMMNMKIFVDEDADVCLARRIKRDVAERGRSVDSVLAQYERYVKPSFEGYILPTKRHSDIVVPRGAENLVAIDLIIKHCALKIQQVDLRKLLPNLVVMADSYQARGLHTLFRDATATRHDFVFYADRLMRLLIEEGLGLLPFERKCVTTPRGMSYYGVEFSAGLCGVSLMPGGEAMENSLRAVCANIRVGKMLIATPSRLARTVAYSKLPRDVGQRHILVLEPVLNTGLSCSTAIEYLLSSDVGCREEHVLVLSVIASRQAATEVCERFPKARLVVSAIDGDVDDVGAVVPGAGDFATRYFGTS